MMNFGLGGLGGFGGFGGSRVDPNMPLPDT